MITGKIPSKPLEKIGLSLSGGGYRAASFHLGAMSYLNHLVYSGKPLLENVKMISTVSGGTITGIIYALQKQKAASFQSIYDFILDKLYNLDLVQEGIQKLNSDGKWNNKYKRKNLINAFAELYEREFTDGKTFKEFNKMNSHLEAVVFNSTEFDNGINFRFRNFGSGYFGNYKIKIPQQQAEEVKLADAMASSSCFTGGFEPMIWPHDFVHDEALVLKKAAESAYPLGLMDGGIYDNQGVESILNYKSNNAEPYFDLVIISDVTSPYMEGYLPTADKEKEGIRKLTLKQLAGKAASINNKINSIFIALILLSAVAPFFVDYTWNGFTGFCLGLSIAFLIVWVSKMVLLKWLKKQVLDFIQLRIKKWVPEFYRDKLAHLKIAELSLRRIEPLILDRIKSLGTLLLDVFLKVVRRLNYSKLYNNNNYRYRRVTNLIRELTEMDYVNKSGRKNANSQRGEKYLTNTILKGTYLDVVGKEIKEITEEAASFGTTLWFTDKQKLGKMLDNLVASGQCTMCYNMLEYLEVLIFEE